MKKFIVLGMTLALWLGLLSPVAVYAKASMGSHIAKNTTSITKVKKQVMKKPVLRKSHVNKTH